MKKTLWILALLLLVSAAIAAETNIGVGIGFESGSVTGSPPSSDDWGATTTNPGNTPLLSSMPTFFFESIFRRRPTAPAFGLDFAVSWAMSQDAAYVAAYQPFLETYSGNPYATGTPGISSSNPELFVSADLSYHLSQMGPLDLGILIGGVGWQDIGDTSQVDLPISAGAAIQAGAELTLHFSGIFVQARGLYRFYWWEAAAVGGGGTPAPLGTTCIAILAGFTLRR
jgi:hypothetical protein